MKYSELPKKLKDAIVGKVTEHDDGSISVDGRVFWDDLNLMLIPIKFRRVSGDFLVYQNKITSLENAPDFVGGSFYCHDSKLTSLDGLGEVDGFIRCHGNPVPEEELVADYRRKKAKKELAGESLAIERLVRI